MTDGGNTVDAPQRSFSELSLSLIGLSHSFFYSFSQTQTELISYQMLKKGDPTRHFLKWLPRAWNWHCESYVTLPCLLCNWSALRKKSQSLYIFSFNHPPTHPLARVLASSLLQPCSTDQISNNLLRTPECWQIIINCVQAKINK